MKLAVFDHQLNYGGGKRFLHNLLSALVEIGNDLKITLFCHLEKAEEADNFQELRQKGVIVRPLLSLQATTSTSPTLFKRATRYMARKIGAYSPVITKNQQETLSEEISHLSTEFDLAYFPWPYLLKSPKTACPKVATFHDFNYRYFFGIPIFSEQQLSFLNESITEWMKDTTPVVSTNFMKRELLCFYPNVNEVHVIHLASLNMYNKENIIKDDQFVFKELLELPYIVFPVHVTSHKNIGSVIAATYLINKNGIRFRLVLTGKYTETIRGKSAEFGLMTGSSIGDVFGLGYISDEQMHYLQQKSFAVINASFYEAGNGVGLDSWPLGVPVLQSNIPAFEEHRELQGFEAFTFDPRSVFSIAEAIEECLTNSEKRQEFVQKSLAASQHLSWEITAKKYLDVFKYSAKKKAYGN